jgi:hypothetical protein
LINGPICDRIAWMQGQLLAIKDSFFIAKLLPLQTIINECEQLLGECLVEMRKRDAESDGGKSS